MKRIKCPLCSGEGKIQKPERYNEIINSLGNPKHEDIRRKQLKRLQKLQDALYMKGKQNNILAQAVHTLRWGLGIEYAFSLQEEAIKDLIENDLISEVDKTKQKYTAFDFITAKIYEVKKSLRWNK